MSVATSHHTSILKNPNVAASEAAKATTMPRLISVIIPGRRLASSPHAPRRKTLPPYRKTIVPRTAGIYCEAGKAGAV